VNVPKHDHPGEARRQCGFCTNWRLTDDFLIPIGATPLRPPVPDNVTVTTFHNHPYCARCRAILESLGIPQNADHGG
jgi:hypothetical protein